MDVGLCIDHKNLLVDSECKSGGESGREGRFVNC
jgi:hypothetical protein